MIGNDVNLLIITAQMRNSLSSGTELSDASIERQVEILTRIADQYEKDKRTVVLAYLQTRITRALSNSNSLLFQYQHKLSERDPIIDLRNRFSHFKHTKGKLLEPRTLDSIAEKVFNDEIGLRSHKSSRYEVKRSTSLRRY